MRRVEELNPPWPVAWQPTAATDEGMFRLHEVTDAVTGSNDLGRGGARNRKFPRV